MNLLATSSATLDEVDDALDLEQTPAECVVLSFSDTDLSAVAAAWQTHRDDLPTLRLASLKKLRHPMSVDVYIESVISKAAMVVVRCLGGLDYWRYGLEQIASVARENGIKFVALPGDDRPDPRLTSLSTEPPETVAMLDAYFRAGGSENLHQALRYLSVQAGRPLTWNPPVPVPALGVWHPDSGLEHIANAGIGESAKPTALIVFYRASVMAADSAPIEALIRALEVAGLNPVALALTSLKDPAVADNLQALIEARQPAIILNATAFSALRDDDTTILDAANVPVLQVVLSSATHEAWQDSDRGLGPTDLAMNVVLPELDGRLLTRAISFKSEAQIDPSLEHASVRAAPLEDRVEYVAKLAANWVRLAQTPRAEKRLALVLSDYPARGGRTGYAVGLDTPQSVREILTLLTTAGYDTGGDIKNLDLTMERLTRQGATDTIEVPLVSYRDWLTVLPAQVRGSINSAWGSPRQDPAFQNGCFNFPCLQAGNVTILLQPDRGNAHDRKHSYHDTTLPPRHAYLALYTFLRETVSIDALIHLGTHGTLEWLPGKALALSNACFPEAVLGPVPVVYPFIVNNPGEAVQAKRRISAVTLGHLTPPLRTAGTHGKLAELEGLIDEYAQADGLDDRRVRLLEQEILEDATRSGLAHDCGVTTDDGPREAIAKLDAQLCDIKELAIRDGLHIFGRSPNREHRDAIIIAIHEADTALNSKQTGNLLDESARNEREALLAALDGKRVAPGPAGAPTRGRIDVLPTGRNLTSIDPRAIPTRTATKIGARAANEVVRRHLQDFGQYPRALVIDLWASASLRTGGDDLAQAFAYLGVRPTWDTNSNRVTGFELIPHPKLERPRIDTTLRISGLFRDIFPTQIALYEQAVGLVADLDEDDQWNPLATTRRNGQSLARVFGGAPGTFGAGASNLALDGTWQDQSDIANAYLSASTHAYGRDEHGVPAAAEFRERVAQADALVHPQDDRERDLLDSDDVADYVGGFKAAAEMLGNDPTLYHLDTSSPNAPKVRTITEEVARITRGRLTNPVWIEGMLNHGHRGVAEIAQGVDALYAFAATARAVPAHLFDVVHEALIADDIVAAAMTRDNPAAARAITQRLADALARGLWVSRRNAVHDELDHVTLSADKALVKRNAALPQEHRIDGGTP